MTNNPFAFLRSECTAVYEAADKARGHQRALLYESPFTDVTPTGPEDLFTTPQLTELLSILDDVRSAALAA